MNPPQKIKVAWVTSQMTDAEAFSLWFLSTGAPPSTVPACPEAAGRCFMPRKFSQLHLTLLKLFLIRFIHTYQSAIPKVTDFFLQSSPNYFLKCETDSWAVETGVVLQTPAFIPWWTFPTTELCHCVNQFIYFKWQKHYTLGIIIFKSCALWLK